MVDYSAHFRELVEAQVPEDARILMPRGGADLTIVMSWYLRSKPLRPRARSRIVRIVIPEHAVQDYAAGTPSDRLLGDMRLAAWLRVRLTEFDSYTDAAADEEPSGLNWEISSEQLNG